MTGCKYYCKLVSGFSNTNCKLFLGRDTKTNAQTAHLQTAPSPPTTQSLQKSRFLPPTDKYVSYLNYQLKSDFSTSDNIFIASNYIFHIFVVSKFLILFL